MQEMEEMQEMKHQYTFNLNRPNVDDYLNSLNKWKIY
jgi:hypothetical protein